MTIKPKNLFIIYIILINFSFILSDQDKCKTLEHCLKCPQSDKCDECESGFVLNYDHTKCDTKENANYKPSSSAKKSSQNQNTPAGSSPKKSSAQNQKPVSSSPKKSSQNNNNSNPPNASNSPQASSKSLLSAFNITKRLGSDSTKIGIKILIFVAISVIIILCIRWVFGKKKKKTKVGYFYDESGNPDEKAKVVIIN